MTVSRPDRAWRFDAIGDRGTRVNFKVEFEFKTPHLGGVQCVFETLCGSIVDAFAVRAKKGLRLAGRHAAASGLKTMITSENRLCR